MGGRGTFASGNNVAYSYETVGKIDGVKVLQKLDKRASGCSIPFWYKATAFFIFWGA